MTLLFKTAESMIEDSIEVQEAVPKGTDSRDADTENNPRERGPLSFLSQHYELH